MISHIYIRDFAIIDELRLDLQEGLNVITGETGAGKSIIIEAISLALGSRADTTFIRSGKEKAIIHLIAFVGSDEIVSLLQENGIPCEDQLIIKREISTAGKSVCRINDELVSVSFLNKLCRKIADIHGQYDHQSLLDPEHHIELVDLYDNKAISKVKEKVASLYKQYVEVKKELAFIYKNEADTQRNIDFMKFEWSEISDAKLLTGEDEALSQQIHLLQNSEQIFKNVSEAYENLYDGVPSALDQLSRSSRLLQDISEFSPEISGYSDLLSDYYYKIEDLSSELRKCRDSISFSGEELDETVGRLDYIESLKRKYGKSIQGILDYKEELEQSLEKLDDIDGHKVVLEQDLANCKTELSTVSKELSQLRKKAAARMEKEINLELAQLNFKDARLSVSFSQLKENQDLSYSENGLDQIEFLITTNKGEVPKPLSKIASGGEISRIMLAFKYIIGDLDKIPTMIFDEIDSGISGITASVVGKKLLQISKRHQILCITHLPQIAAYGDHHYGIRKITEETSTHTTVLPLTYAEKVEEIARLLGGMNITETTMKNAEELLQLSRI